MLRHEPPSDHPESPTRLDAVMGTVRMLERQGRLSVATPRPATEDDILLVHTSEYVKKVRAEIAAGRRTLSTGDTELSSGSLTAALAAAGTVVSAVDAVMNGRTRTAFCAVRPPGHHASQSRGMGFCVFNNIAVGARHARRRHRVDRILIADWDVHHGNGTQEVFWSDGAVLFFDIHQHPWYPGTGNPDEKGDGKGRGLIVNNPFPAGAGRKEILGVFRDVLVPAADRFKPQLVMISAGFDSRAGDPLGRFTLTDQDFAELTDVVLGIARRHAGGRLVSVLEGGYSLEGLPLAVASHLARLSS
ncbi:MAG: histone deacetylase [Acidobacteria bacterium 13_1_40CM_65_14]|nr:MAG: histone deacetylase [Acidobacteria bacterium 13_1_40CM_65_14]